MPDRVAARHPQTALPQLPTDDYPPRTSAVQKETSVLARLALLAYAALILPGFVGVFGPKGNDTGGIIPWSRQAEATARSTANANCGIYGKYALIISVRRVYGDYIAYECRFDRRRPNTTYEPLWGRAAYR